jgi:hypothetical protein
MLDDDCQGDVGDGSGSSANKGVRCFPNVVMIIIRQRQFIGATSSRLTLHFRSCSSRGRRVKEIGNSFGRLMGGFFFGLCGSRWLVHFAIVVVNISSICRRCKESHAMGDGACWCINVGTVVVDVTVARRRKETHECVGILGVQHYPTFGGCSLYYG